MSKILDYSVKELEKMKHIESYANDKKTIVEYRKHFWSDNLYLVGILRKSKEKKGKGGKPYYELVYQSKHLDSTIFAYNNTHVMDFLYMKPHKNLLDLKSKDNVKKTLLLDADHDIEVLTDERLRARNTTVKAKEMRITIIPNIDDEELCP